MLKSLEMQARGVIEQQSLTGIDAIRYYEMGIARQSLGDHELALACFTVAIILIPDWIECYNSRSEAFISLHRQFAEFALDDLNQAIKLNPELAQTYRNRGSVYELINCDTDALQDYNKAISLDLSNADGYFRRALIFEKLNRYNDALEDYLQVIRLRPEDYQAHVFAGLIFANTNRFQQALSHFQEAARLGSSEGEALAVQLRQILNLDH